MVLLSQIRPKKEDELVHNKDFTIVVKYFTNKDQYQMQIKNKNIQNKHQNQKKKHMCKAILLG